MNPQEGIAPIVIDSLSLQSVPVTLAGKKYVLVELTGKQRDDHLTNVSSRMRYTDDGKPQGMKNFTDLQSGLIAQSLHVANEDGSAGAAVPITTIQAWPARVQEQLAAAVQKLSGLDKDANAVKEAAKND